MLVAQFTRLFRSHAYRLFCYMIKLDGYERKLRLLTEECQCIICEKGSQHKQKKMDNKRKLEENAQIEELKMSLIRASANIARLEYICATQEHELKMLGEKLCDFKGVKETVNNLKDGLDELKLNIKDLDIQQQPNSQSFKPDIILETRLNCLEILVKEIEEQDRYCEVLAGDTEELKQQLHALKDTCERQKQDDHLENESRYANCSVDNKLWTISSNTLKYGSDPTDESDKNTRYMVTNSSGYSTRQSSETALDYVNISFETVEPSMEKVNTSCSCIPSSYIENQKVQSSSDANIDKSASNYSKSISVQFTKKCKDVASNNLEPQCHIASSDRLYAYPDEMEEGRSIIETQAGSVLTENRSKIDFSDAKYEKTRTSEASTSETLKCSSSVDPISSGDEFEGKDIETNVQNCFTNCFYCWATVWNLIFD